MHWLGARGSLMEMRFVFLSVRRLGSEEEVDVVGPANGEKKLLSACIKISSDLAPEGGGRKHEKYTNVNFLDLGIVLVF